MHVTRGKEAGWAAMDRKVCPTYSAVLADSRKGTLTVSLLSQHGVFSHFCTFACAVASWESRPMLFYRKSLDVQMSKMILNFKEM